jgi:uncharacterized protein YbbC (DUF1343 family)
MPGPAKLWRRTRLPRYTAGPLLVLAACSGVSDDVRTPGIGDARTLGPNGPRAEALAIPPSGLPAREGVRLGVDVLLARGGAPLVGKRVGLITNHTGISAFTGAERTVPDNTIDLLHAHPDIALVALFSPEHGIRGTAAPGERVGSGVDERTGLPIHSLYGRTTRPAPDMLRGLDALVFDIQDIGTRYYTYVWTMALAMQAAGEQGVEFVVLDRPNPIGGELVQGNVLDPAHASFVGLYPVPMRHGLTAGELALMLAGELGRINVRLTVVPVEGWARAMWFDETGLPWVAPSPNMPSLESALHYPGTCLFEGTNLSVGRGTTEAFRQIGAPWLDAHELARRVTALALPGLAVEPATFTPASPGDGKYDGVEVHGIRLTATDRERYDPTRAAVATLLEVRRMHADEFRWIDASFDRLAGTRRLRAAIERGAGVDAITAEWQPGLLEFMRMRKRYLLYR